MDDPDATGAVRSGARFQKRRRISAPAYGSHARPGVSGEQEVTAKFAV